MDQEIIVWVNSGMSSWSQWRFTNAGEAIAAIEAGQFSGQEIVITRKLYLKITEER